MKKAFTLIELVVAVAILAMVLSFAGVIFKVSINAYRTAMANTEIMQKLRAITDQLNRDFKGLQKDGYLMLFSEVQPNRREYQNSDPCNFRADRLYYFSTGDFQSWFEPNIRSNIARVYFGHDWFSLIDDNIPVSKWNLARDVILLTPGHSSLDCNDISYAERKADWLTWLDASSLLGSGIPIDIETDANDVRRLMCQNAGAMQIEWTDGTKLPPNNSLAWFGFDLLWSEFHDIPPIDDYPFIEYKWGTYYIAFWIPDTRFGDEWPGDRPMGAPGEYWPKALKFTFTLYDSKGILEGGRTFTHIVYIGE